MSGYDRDEYLWYKSRGICVSCRREDALPGRVRCADCLDKNADGKMRYYRNMTEERRKEISHRENARQVNRMHARKENGLCKICGRPNPEAATRSRCRECRNRRNKYILENKQKIGYIPRSEWPENGMCYRCKAPIDKGRLCEKCIEQNRRSSRMGPWREMAKAENNRCFKQ